MSTIHPIRAYKECLQQQLSTYYDSSEAEAIARQLLEEAYAVSYARLVIDPPKDTQLSKAEEKIKYWMSRLLHHEPLQYVLGRALFHDTELSVGPGVLIPRPETEELCLLVTDEVNHIAAKVPQTEEYHVARAIDLCTGSGCIAHYLCRAFPNAHIEALDWSEAALATAATNLAPAIESGQCHLYRADLLSPSHMPLSPLYEVVVSNPPYVLESERREMLPHVLEYEPEMALFVSDDAPLLFYHAILEHYTPRLAPLGFMAWEINPLCAEALCSLCTAHGLHPRLYPDLSGRIRFLIAHRHPAYVR